MSRKPTKKRKLLLPKPSEIEKLPLIKYIKIFLGINFISIIFIVFMKDRLPPEIPLFYGLPRGNDQLTSSLGLVIPSAISLIIILVNTTISLLIKDDFLKKVLILASFVSVLLATITTYKILFLVGNI